MDDVQKETSGAFKRLLLLQLAGVRDETPVADFEKANKDAEDLYEVTD